MRSRSSISFLPTDYVERKSSRRVNAVCAVLFLTMMLGIGSMMMQSSRALHAALVEHEQVTKAFSEAAGRVEQIRQMQDEQRRLDRLARGAASITEKMPRSYLLAEITNAMPPGVTLIDFNLDTALAPQPADRPPLVSLRVTGNGESNVPVSQFVNTLTRSKIFKNVSLRANAATEVTSPKAESATSVAASARPDGTQPASQVTTAPSEATRFVVEMTLDPNAAILAAEPKIATTAIELKPE